MGKGGDSGFQLTGMTTGCFLGLKAPVQGFF